MEYIESCLEYPVLNICILLGFAAFIFIQYKRGKIHLKEIRKLALILGILIIPSTFLDLRFYYEYLHNPEIEEVIEMEDKITKEINPLSVFVGKRHRNGYEAEFVYSKDSREFLLGDCNSESIILDESEKEMFEIIEGLKEEGELSDLADNYLNDQKDKMNSGNKFKVIYKKTKRYNIITSIKNIG